MVLTIDLTPELEQRLSEAAAHEGVPASDYLLRLLDRHLPQAARQRALIDLLQSWIDEDVTDEDNTESEAILRSLDAHRESDRPLYPEKLRGVTCELDHPLAPNRAGLPPAETAKLSAILNC